MSDGHEGPADPQARQEWLRNQPSKPKTMTWDDTPVTVIEVAPEPEPEPAPKPKKPAPKTPAKTVKKKAAKKKAVPPKKRGK